MTLIVYCACVWETFDLTLSKLQINYWEYPWEKTKNQGGWLRMIELHEINITHCQVIISTSGCSSAHSLTQWWKPNHNEKKLEWLCFLWLDSPPFWLLLAALRLKCNMSTCTDLLFKPGITGSIYQNVPTQNNSIRYTLRAPLSVTETRQIIDPDSLIVIRGYYQNTPPGGTKWCYCLWAQKWKHAICYMWSHISSSICHKLYVFADFFCINIL